MAGYERSTRGLSPAQIKRRKRRPAGAPRAGETTARTSGTGKTQPVMAGTKKAADKARAKAKRTSVTTTKRKPAAKTTTTTKKSTPKFNPTYRAARKKILRETEDRPAKPKPSDYKSASAYKRAADSWNRKYGTQGTTTKPKKGVDYDFKQVKIDPNKRGKARLKGALGAVVGPILGGGAAGALVKKGGTALARRAITKRQQNRIESAEKAYKDGKITKGELAKIKRENKPISTQTTQTITQSQGRVKGQRTRARNVANKRRAANKAAKDKQRNTTSSVGTNVPTPRGRGVSKVKQAKLKKAEKAFKDGFITKRELAEIKRELARF